jgi:Tol biopolymer transport system component
MKYTLLVLLVVLAACAPNTTTLPTALDLTAIDGATATAAAAGQATQTATSNAARPPTLPATWTAAPPGTTNSAPLPFDTQVPRLNASGALYFIFGGLGIARLEVGSSISELIGGVGLEPRELTLSPDGQRLVFTGLASGSARELYVINTDGSGLRQVSCLGFARTLLPRWSPDSSTLLFAASTTLDGVPGVYTARADGACPTENAQRQLISLNANDLFGLAWSNDRTSIFVGQTTISRLTISQNILIPLTNFSGYGPDFSPAPRPGTTQLFYLKTFFGTTADQRGGTVYQLDLAIPGRPTERPGATLYASRLQWSQDGRYLLIESVSNIWVQDQNTVSTLPVVEGSLFAPGATFSPDASAIAFVDADPNSDALPQIYLISRTGERRTQASFHRDGSITDLNWGQG